MAEQLTRNWQPSWDAPSRRDRRGGAYQPYVPDPLAARAVTLEPALSLRAAQIESMVRDLTSPHGSRGLEGLARFLLRSEAIASSRIEGLQASPQQVALAELAATEDESITGFTTNARLVANNIITLRHAAGDLARADAITTEGVVALHRALLPEHAHQGLRSMQNWIGGSDWHPLDAQFVPPPAEQVPSLMSDLAMYASGGAHAPLVQAALVHAQFETIHPFVDGNGRVGRALIHTVLTRRGLTRTAVIPVSLVLLTRSDTYVAGLTSYRALGPPDASAAREGVGTWIGVFLDAVEVAVDQARTFAGELDDLRAEWRARHAAHRSAAGRKAAARAGSTVARLLDLLPEAPLVTARTVQRLLDVSFPAARMALEELAEVGILRRKRVDHGTTGYLAKDVFDLLTFAERRLASTKWDTRESRPRRPVPARPRPQG